MDLNNNFNKSDQPLWSKAYTLAFKYTKSTRVMEFQLKFLNRRIATNDFLTKIGLEYISNCDFWGEGKKGLAHLFWFCFKISSIWSSLISRRVSFEVLPAQYELKASIDEDIALVELMESVCQDIENNKYKEENDVFKNHK